MTIPKIILKTKGGKLMELKKSKIGQLKSGILNTAILALVLLVVKRRHHRRTSGGKSCAIRCWNRGSRQPVQCTNRLVGKQKAQPRWRGLASPLRVLEANPYRLQPPHNSNRTTQNSADTGKSAKRRRTGPRPSRKAGHMAQRIWQNDFRKWESNRSPFDDYGGNLCPRIDNIR